MISIPAPERQRICEQGFTTFTFVRNPYERVLSGKSPLVASTLLLRGLGIAPVEGKGVGEINEKREGESSLPSCRVYEYLSYTHTHKLSHYETASAAKQSNICTLLSISGQNRAMSDRQENGKVDFRGAFIRVLLYAAAPEVQAQTNRASDFLALCALAEDEDT